MEMIRKEGEAHAGMRLARSNVDRDRIVRVRTHCGFVAERCLVIPKLRLCRR